MKALINISTILVALLIIIVSCSSTNAQERTQELKSVEIREYQGANLSSIKDFRENSIKGPQYINREKYRLEVTGLVQRPNKYTYDEVITNYKSYEKLVTLNCVEGWSVNIRWG